LQNPTFSRLSKLLEPLFPIALANNLQFHVKRVSDDCLLGFFPRHVVLRNVSQIGFIPIKNQRTVVHKTLQNMIFSSHEGIPVLNIRCIYSVYSFRKFFKLGDTDSLGINRRLHFMWP